MEHGAGLGACNWELRIGGREKGEASNKQQAGSREQVPDNMAAAVVANGPYAAIQCG